MDSAVKETHLYTLRSEQSCDVAEWRLFDCRTVIDTTKHRPVITPVRNIKKTQPTGYGEGGSGHWTQVKLK